MTLKILIRLVLYQTFKLCLFFRKLIGKIEKDVEKIRLKTGVSLLRLWRREEQISKITILSNFQKISFEAANVTCKLPVQILSYFK